jgi:hypothetical protein
LKEAGPRAPSEHLPREETPPPVKAVQPVPFLVEAIRVARELELEGLATQNARMVVSAPAGQIDGASVPISQACVFQGGLNKGIGINSEASNIVKKMGVVVPPSIEADLAFREPFERLMIFRVSP